MKKLNFTPLIYALLLSLLMFLPAHAQQEEDAPPPENETRTAPPNNRPRLLEELNLSDEQIRQIRRINQRRPLIQQAQRKWREAQRNLDTAIYADDASEEEIKLRLKEAQAAYNEFIKMRSETEYLIRQVLTPEQLRKFRQLRERARQMLGNPNGATPPRRLNRFPRRRPPVQPLD